MTKHILLDMDGVLVDFIGGAYGLHQRPMPDAVPWRIWEEMGLTEEEFWAPMGHDFWANLPWTPEGQLLVRQLELMVGAENICLLTSPCLTPGCAEGKLAWIGRHLPQYRRQYLLGPAKGFAAGPGKVLVDDHEKNVADFRSMGGGAVLVPRPWNSNASHLDRYDTPADWVRLVAFGVLGHL